METILNKIYDYSLEEIMGERFGRYSKSIIQDRALPDIRDGLKPVQRRILYAMYRDKNTFDKPYKKSAKAVGNIMGNYHPHGDSSIYDAMVRMSQWWKQNTPYIDMHGNNGSIDGDSAAAMRYTEARLSKISMELLKDIDKDTVDMVWNFDDTLKEPVVLPSKFPNLLVNGANGISAGYATNIPTHNLGEVIDATIKRIDSPNCRLDTLLEIIKGPDFPTGAIVEGKKGIIDAFTTGRGKVMVKSKCEFISSKGKDMIVVTEIPFEVNKSALVKKIDEIRIDKKIEGIQEVLDESNFEDPTRIDIILKKDADKELILNYLLKNTDLQVSYNYNMVAIKDGRPMTVGIIPILDAYIEHQKEVITRRCKFDLDVYNKRLHIIEGLIKAISILDEVIATIRKSKNKSDAKENLVSKYGFTMEQAEYIVMLQLYRLTNEDVVELSNEYDDLKNKVAALNVILSDEAKLKSLMKHELKKVKDEYATPRRTELVDEITEIKIDTTKMIPKEDVIVVVTKEGYIKRVSPRSMTDNETGLKDSDIVIGKYKMNTMDTLLMFTDKGNYLHIPVYEIPELKWKDLGKHVSNVITVSSDENVIASIPVYDFEEDEYITIFTKDGMVKRTKLSEFRALRYSKAITAIKLKAGDLVASVTNESKEFTMITTTNGYALAFKTEEIPVVGLKTSGVKSIALKNDTVVSGMLYDESLEYLTILTDKGTGKRIKLSEFNISTRARRGDRIIKDIKTNPYHIVSSYIINYKEMLTIVDLKDVFDIKLTELSISDKNSAGSSITKNKILSSNVIVELTSKEDKITIEKENAKTEETEHVLTIDDFLKDL
ncbi:MAG: DNA topoisomerase IV subunit A [Bacilli bacterium]|nr:DNA topoisomerase IV subunit A [Bacilli bacterium]